MYLLESRLRTVGVVLLNFIVDR